MFSQDDPFLADARQFANPKQAKSRLFNPDGSLPSEEQLKSEHIGDGSTNGSSSSGGGNEDARLQALLDEQSRQLQRTQGGGGSGYGGYGSGGGGYGAGSGGMRGRIRADQPLPPDYVCNRCNQPGKSYTDMLEEHDTANLILISLLLCF